MSELVVEFSSLAGRIDKSAAWKTGISTVNADIALNQPLVLLEYAQGAIDLVVGLFLVMVLIRHMPGGGISFFLNGWVAAKAGAR